AQVDPDRADGRGVAHSEANGVRKIVQLIGAVLNALHGRGGGGGRKNGRRRRHAKGHASQPAVNVSGVVEKRAPELRAELRDAHGEAKLLVEDQLRLAADRETRSRIARPGLIQSKSAKRIATAGKEAFGQRNEGGKRRSGGRGKSERDGVAVGLEDAEAERTCETEAPLDWVIGGILREKAEEAGARAKAGVGEAEVEVVERAARGVGGIVPVVAKPGDAEFGYEGGRV